ncbi:MAG: glutamate synthase (NADPH/NADH) small chain [Granulosicoccus sp.]|jgi:glutamate synthase (NADPH/NADH) small chain
MSDPQGFLKYKRELPKSRKPAIRVKDYHEIYKDFSDKKVKTQASRCMDCGVPFCLSGCPLGNVIPDFNDAIYQEDWEDAYHILSATNNFPEFTGRICPAPCESKCVLGINQSPVAIELIEKNIIEKAFEKGFIRPNPPVIRSGKKVAVVGSGPAGLATAAQLNIEGHSVTVFERSSRIGGLLRYGIPDFKLEKWVIDRRLQIMEAEGIRFEVNANVGENIPVKKLTDEFDAIVLCGGSTVPRKLNVKGEDLKGVHFAMEFLEQNNKRVAGDTISKKEELVATGKNVLVIGGGDTGSDCIGTSNRHGAKSVLQLEILVQPPKKRPTDVPWTAAPMLLKTTSSHEEGCEREWAILTKEFIGDKKGNLKAVKLVNLKWVINDATGRSNFEEIEGTEREIPCELALLAVGYLHPQKAGLLEKLNIELTDRGNVKEENYQTNLDKVFTAGDMRRGQSLVVWAIAEGRKAAESVNEFLLKEV